MAVDLRDMAPSGIRECLGNGDMQIPVMVRIMEDQLCPAMFPCRVKQPAVRTALVRTFDSLSEGINGNHLHACSKTPVTSTDQVRLWAPEYDGFLEPVKALAEGVMPPSTAYVTVSCFINSSMVLYLARTVLNTEIAIWDFNP